jgi:hypothetical protein
MKHGFATRHVPANLHGTFASPF